MRYQIELTGSQLMALRSILAAHQMCEGHPESYLDCSQEPAVETRPEDLLILAMTARSVDVSPALPKYAPKRKE